MGSLDFKKLYSYTYRYFAILQTVGCFKMFFPLDGFCLKL